MRLLAGLGALALCALPAGAQDSPYLQVHEQVAPRVHLFRQGGVNFAGVVGNVTLIEQADGLVLVDTGASAGLGRRLVAMIRAVSAKPVKAVVVTHWHNDHPLGISAIREAWPGVPVIATANAAAALKAGRANTPIGAPDPAWDATRAQRLDDYVRQFEEEGAKATTDAERRGWAAAVATQKLRKTLEPGTHVVLPDRTFDDRLLLDDPEFPVEVRFLGRANTDGDAVAWLPRQRILVAGDAVVSPVPYAFNVYPAEWIAVLEAMKALRFAVLIPGHGEVQRDTAYLDRLIAFMRDVRAQAATLAKSDATPDTAGDRMDSGAQARIFAGDDPWVRYWFKSYAWDPFAQSALKEARGEALGPPAPTK